MKFTFFVLSYSILTAFTSFSQNDWQQTVNYKIDVQLNDIDHFLDGQIEMEYINNSPDALTFIYIHLWPNAYSSDKTALAKQIYQEGNDILRFEGESSKGCIDQLNFMVDGKIVKWEFDPQNIDIAKIYLTTPLQSGARIKITTPFQVKIPSGRISRLGHVGQSYQITQWYPKPAVYDKNGWHPIPYLSQGEFYSEYGSFDVSITLPENYVVGATGDLQNDSEIEFLNSKVEETKLFLDKNELKRVKFDEFPASSEKIKTIRYTQSKVHDFAWFADKRYYVLKDEVELPHSKRKVTTWAMFTPKNANLWKNASEYLKDGTYYYSLWNGDYPYNHVTAVDGTISAGGGMEYPNITVIGNASSAEELEIVIVHEVGHNWFYGILGSNERDHGWMDEGLNTLNEIRYIQTKYPGNTRLSDMVLNGKMHFNELDYHDQADFQFQLITRFGEDQPIETKSQDFYSLNYGLIMYQKTGLIFHYLKSYLGDELFDECMSAYFEKWKFRHPQPEDLKAIFEEKTGKKLDWFFTDLIQTTNHIDYKVKNVKSKNGKAEITIKNVGQVNGPIPVAMSKVGGGETTQWIENDTERKHEIITDYEVSKVQIDSLNNIPEINRSNNTWTSGKLFNKCEPMKLEFLAGDNEPNSTNLFWSPVFGFNTADQFMLGLAIHNIGIPANPVQFYVAPMYSFGRQMVSGIADLSYTFLPKNLVKQTKLGISGRSFKMDNINRGNVDYYYAITPYLRMKLGNRNAFKPWSNEILVKTVVRQDVLTSREQTSVGGYIDYMLNYDRADHEWETHLKTDYYQNTKLLTEATRSMFTSTYRFRYLKKKSEKWVELRVFGGKIWSIKSDPSEFDNTKFALSGNNGVQDLFFDDLFFNRIPGTGSIYNTMRADNMGGFRSTASFGNASDWMTTANLYLELPLPIFGIFADAGAFSNNGTMESVWNLGVGIRIRKLFQIHFPVLMSENLMASYSSQNYLNKIRVTVNLNMLTHPFQLRNLF
tara:strand:- start:35383 stop:38364 length:2982 start_codon:yes stop_codon:yes gene_type:complete